MVCCNAGGRSCLFLSAKPILVTDDEIKIDRGAPLKWRNVREAEELIGRQRIIVLKTG